jgi:pimeloyl-ACP methyl ester carboxylesterase
MYRRLFFATLLLAAWIQANGSSALILHCQGEGPSVYLIGGGPAFTTWNLEPIQNRLSSDYLVCRWDQRGVGDNAGLEISSDRSALSQWLEDMVAVLPDEPVTLWGHSWGALQVLLFTRLHPERVKMLVLSNPVDPALRSLKHIENKRFSHPGNDARLRLEDMGTPVEDLHNLRSKVASYFVDADKGWRYAQGFTGADANSQLNIRIWDEYRRDPLGDADVRRIEEKIRGVIYCRDDVLQPESHTEYLRVLDAGKHFLLSDCAHFPWEENPDEYFYTLIRLLDEHY